MMTITGKSRSRSLVVVMAMMAFGQLSFAEEKKEETSKEHPFQVLNSQRLQDYVQRFNADDEERHSNMKNEDAFEFLQNNIPLLEY